MLNQDKTVKNQHAFSLVLIISIILLSFLSLPLIDLPLARDQGIWSTIGLALYKGKVFYSDIIHFHLPGLGFFYAFLYHFFDDPRVITAIMHLIGSLIILLSTFFLIKEELGEKEAEIFAVLYAVLYPTAINFWDISQKDFFSIAFVFLATYCLSRTHRKEQNASFYLLSAGISVGIATLFKPIFGIAGIALAFFEIIKLNPFKPSRDLYRLFKNLMLLLIGFVAVASVFFIYLYQNEALITAFTTSILFSLFYAGNDSLTFANLTATLFIWSSIPDPRELLLSIFNAIIWLPLLIFGVILFLKKQRRGKVFWLWVPIFVSLFSFYLQRKGYAYHLTPWITCSFIFVSLSIRSILSKLRLQLAVILIMLYLLPTILLSTYTTKLLPEFFGITPRSAYLKDNFKPIYSALPSVSEEIAIWINQNTAVDDKIYVWGMENQLYSLSKRLFVSRHHFNVILAADLSADPILHAWQSQERAIFLKTLKETLPAVFIVAHDLKKPHSRKSSDTGIHLVKGLPEFIENNYRIETQKDRFDVFTLINKS